MSVPSNRDYIGIFHSKLENSVIEDSMSWLSFTCTL